MQPGLNALHKVSYIVSQTGSDSAAALAALEACACQLELVRSLRECYNAELQADVAAYNLVSRAMHQQCCKRKLAESTMLHETVCPDGWSGRIGESTCRRTQAG